MACPITHPALHRARRRNRAAMAVIVVACNPEKIKMENARLLYRKPSNG